MSKISRRGVCERPAALAPLAVTPFIHRPTSVQGRSLRHCGSGRGAQQHDCSGLPGESWLSLLAFGRTAYRGRRRKDRLIDAQRIQGRRLFNSAHVSARQSMIKNDELKLRDFGLEYVDPDPIFHIPFADGSCLTQWRTSTAHARIREISKKDAAAYRKMLGEF